MNDSKKFNYFIYPMIIEKMKKNKITAEHLSFLTNISQRTIYHILKNEENFENTSFHNVQLLMSALNITEQLVVDDYYKTMYALGEDCNVVAIQDVVNGSRNFQLNDEDFDLIVKLLEKLAVKETT